MKRARVEHSTVAVVLLLYGLLIVPVALWPKSNALIGMAWTCLYSLIALGLALEFTEVLFAFLWPPMRIQCFQGRINRRSTAVLMTTCNDTDPSAVAALMALSEAGYSVYLLDDSSSEPFLSEEIRASIIYRRRPTRVGAKAGNLNDWVGQYGDRYSNIVLLDSDSTMTVHAVDTLVRAAEHPDNAEVAIFQSKIEPRCDCGCSRLSAVLGAGARPRARILERVHARLGVLLSFGHNQLIRLDHLRLAGGFSEVFSSEDTALSLAISALGLRTELVDVWSFDTEPRTIDSWVRRTVRWSRQTVELFQGDWSSCPLRLKLLLCRHLLSYALPLIGLVLLIISLATGPRSPNDVIEFSKCALRLDEGYTLYGFSIWSTLAILALSMVLRFTLALVEGVPLGLLMASVITAPALQAIPLAPVAFGMIASAIGCRTRFIPTNCREPKRGARGGIAPGLAYCGVTWAIGMVLLAIGVTRPGTALVGFNAIWVSAFVMSPIVSITLAGRSPRKDTPTPQMESADET